MPVVLAQIEEAIAAGATLAGFISYASGQAFEAVKASAAPVAGGASKPPLVWMAQFETETAFDIAVSDEPVATPDIEPLISRSRYETMISSALERIRAGDIYQVNLTFPATLAVPCTEDLYRAARQRARAPFGAFVNMGERQILSFSPELFFRLDGEAVQSRPMKGTRPRKADPSTDRAMRDELYGSPKDRAENLMIVDLIRNDLSRVCAAGSVAVSSLFDIEPYPTVWQMTSNVTGTLSPESGVMDILAALFPCGSITGAPKIMASKIIAELEGFDRGVYTGEIGVMNGRSTVLNVAIRTIDVENGYGCLHVGSGIVADSDPRDEWRECLSKARFLGKISHR